MRNELKDKRNYGIDSMRVIAMYMICMIHINAFVEAHTLPMSGHEMFFYFSTFTESVGLIGVNIYAMITGFVCVQSQWKLQRFIVLWFQVAFYTISIFLFALIINRFGVLPVVSIDGIIKSMIKLPFGSTYWYFVAYTGLFFILPLLNRALLSLTQISYMYLMIVLFVFLLTINIIEGDKIYGGGYNLIWLICLYIAGAYIKLYNPKFNKLVLFSISLLCVITPLVCRLLKLPAPLGYCMPNFVLYSFSFFVFFYDLKINSYIIRKLIHFFAPLTFGVYLIHQHPWGGEFVKLEARNLFCLSDYYIFFPIIFALLLYLVCSLIDYMRGILFRSCRISEFSFLLATHIEKNMSKIINYVIRITR